MNLHFILENLGGLIFYAGLVMFPFDHDTGTYSILIGAGISGMGSHGNRLTESIQAEIGKIRASRRD